MFYVLKNTAVLNGSGKAELKDIIIDGTKIKAIADAGTWQGDEAHAVDLKGALAAPGFVDLHVHLREPGGEHKETIETGTKAAAKGGFTAIAAMPNTRPVPDHPGQMEWLQKKISETAAVRVLPYASITARQAGKELTDFKALKEKGAFAFTDDGVGVQTAAVMYAAMQEAAALDMAIVAHCEDNSLIFKGSVHEGAFSKKHGLKGIPSICESVQIARDVLLAEAAGCHYHVCHISTKESVRTVRDAKKAGIRVTAEVTPHHLILSEDDIPGLDPNFKMNPPLRSNEDREALIEGLLDRTIDFIATDHAPHALEEKAEGMTLAPFGITGLETAFPLLHTHLVKKGILSLKELVYFLTEAPAKCFGLPFGRLEEGGAADLVVIDLEKEKNIDKNSFLSKGKNTPFHQWACTGWPVLTIHNGQIVFEKGKVLA
ncbi:dihydroorotase [Metabacillus sp. GX 13764]|uniref:dihydroorotase n=1 Tax=Metabacillus kandeliae TaxID=2900151 RepID=UPI001E4D5EEA|nr:dihydroorotase [Metabacillus kandeliae]MCD7033863.1 dihydroorotase [Metabacillus kandeliae]